MVIHNINWRGKDKKRKELMMTVETPSPPEVIIRNLTRLAPCGLFLAPLRAGVWGQTLLERSPNGRWF